MLSMRSTTGFTKLIASQQNQLAVSAPALAVFRHAAWSATSNFLWRIAMHILLLFVTHHALGDEWIDLELHEGGREASNANIFVRTTRNAGDQE